VKILDHGYLELVESWGSDESIIEAARMSTGKGFLGWGYPEGICENCHGQGETPRHGVCSRCHGTKVQKPGDEKLLRYLWENKHATPFEMAGATFEVKAPIFVFREWHRHRVPFGYNEMSARYVPLPDENYVPTVERLLSVSKTNKQAGTAKDARELTEETARQFQRRLVEEYATAQDLYEGALVDGVPKELARLIVPVGRYSKMRATGNLRGWLSFLTLREAPNAQWEIRQYAIALHALLAEKFPRTISLFEEAAHG
jgi:thymidylate synthase (FAD)